MSLHGHLPLQSPLQFLGNQTKIFYERCLQTGSISWAGPYEQILGYSPVNMPSHSDALLPIIHPNDREKVAEHLAQQPESWPTTINYRFRCQDGEYLHVTDDLGFCNETMCFGCVSLLAEDEFRLDDPFRLFNATPVGMLLVDLAGSIVLANSRACDMFGYRAEELKSEAVEILLVESLREAHCRAREEYCKQPRTQMMSGRELSGRKRDGTIVPLLIGLNPISLRGRQFVVVSIMELAEKKKAEKELARFFELSPDLLIIADTNGYFRRINPSVPRTLGYTERELTSSPFLEFVHHDDRQATLDEMTHLNEGAPTIRFRNRYRHARGHYLWLEWNAMPVPEEDLIFAVARDLTQQIEMEKVLRSQEQRERDLLNNTSAMVYMKNEVGVYQFVNESFCETLGIPSQSILGKRDEEIIAQDFLIDFHTNEKKVMDDKSPIQIEETLHLADGPHNFLSVKLPLFDQSGSVNGIAGILTDITDRLNAQKAQEEMRLARLVQEKLYPDQDPVIPGYDIAGASHPMSQLCGDYFDYIHSEDGKRLVLAVGDVSGHGLGPAMQMVEIRALIRMLLSQSNDLLHTIRQVNNIIIADNVESSFITLFLADIDLQTREMRYIGAGHDAWMILGNDQVQKLDSTGVPVGILQQGEYAVSAPIRLNPGDLLLQYTDGVVEAMSPDEELFGADKALKLVKQNRHRPAREIVETLYATVREYAGARPLTDDMTAIVLKAE